MGDKIGDKKYASAETWALTISNNTIYSIRLI
jgi:hypothetical protein